MTSVILALDVAWGAESGQASVLINYRNNTVCMLMVSATLGISRSNFASEDRRSPTRRQYQ
jgi:hypothetical protein